MNSERGYPITDLEAFHAGTDRIDDSRDLVAGHERDLRGKDVTAEHHQIGRAHARRSDADPNLSGAGLLDGDVQTEGMAWWVIVAFMVFPLGLGDPSSSASRT
jgi:hypothetical protein